MVFTSLDFAIFLGVALILNWRLKGRPAIYPHFLLAANLIFYGLAAPRFLPLLLFVGACNWFSARQMFACQSQMKRRLWLWLDVSLCLGLLFFFKYFEWAAETLLGWAPAAALIAGLELPEIFYPVGLSFFTFQGLSLAIDHYRKPELAPPELLSALIFVSFFPTLLSGPIQRAGDFIPQIRANSFEPENFNLALTLILSGLFKKIALSSYVSEVIVRQVFQVPDSFSAWGVWAGIYGYSAQIYLDFSGYSDLALGIGLLLGYNVGVNFNAPYLAANIRDFWRRWHISLSSWLRDYLYISLGGNRRGRARQALNLFLTQFLGGLWHGAHVRYLIWGAAHGAALIISHFFALRRKDREKMGDEMGLKAWQRAAPRFEAAKKLAGWFVTFNFVSLAWILFRAEDMTRALEIVGAGLDFQRGGPGAPPLVWAVILLTLLMQIFGLRLRGLFMGLQARLPLPLMAPWCAFWVILILKLGPAGVLPFIYFQY